MQARLGSALCLRNVALLALATPCASAQTCAEFLNYPTLGGVTCNPLDLSSDGSVVVGMSRTGDPGPNIAWRWTASTGMQSMGTLGGASSRAAGVSADGTIIAGNSLDANGVPKVFLWTATTGMQDMGAPFPSPFLAVAGLSDDGATILVLATPASGGSESYLWTAATGYQYLNQGPAFLSANGEYVVGSVPNGNPWIWDAVLGVRDLGFAGHAACVSDDGVVFGTDANSVPYRWTEAGGAQPLAGLTAGYPIDVTPDGTIVLGAESNIGGPLGAFRWSLGGGAEPFLPAAGDIYPFRISDDGSVVIGSEFMAVGFLGFRVQNSPIGETYCRPAVPNSTGCAGVLLASGELDAANGSLELTATLLPPNAFGFLLASRTRGFSNTVPMNQGHLCLDGAIGRFIGPGQVMNSGPRGTFTLAVDLSAIPTPTGLVAVQPGEEWNFQAWHRDVNSTPVSNFTDAVSLTFR